MSQHHSRSLQILGIRTCLFLHVYISMQHEMEACAAQNILSAGLPLTSAKINIPSLRSCFLLWRRLARLLLDVFGCMTEPRLH